MAALECIIKFMKIESMEIVPHFADFRIVNHSIVVIFFPLQKLKLNTTQLSNLLDSVNMQLKLIISSTA